VVVWRGEMGMRFSFSRRNLLIFAIAIVIAVFLSVYKLPYYIHKPGSADPLDPIVHVDGGYESSGEMHLMTVRSSVATPIQYIFAQFLPYHDIIPIEDVRPEGVTEEEYRLLQLQMMEDSQLSSKVVAYTAAGAEVEFSYNGVYAVAVVEGMPAEGHIEVGDQIVAIDNQEVNQSSEMIDIVEKKEVGEDVHILLNRDGEEVETVIQVDILDEESGRVGVGVQLVEDQDVTVHPDVEFSSGNIGGPSAGLMFALEMYDQLTEEDLTRGYSIAGTGKVNVDGKILPIGGIDKKVVAADREGCEIFFAPNEEGSPTSNYALAKETAEDIQTDMKIIPVDSFEEALEYLQDLDIKE